MKRIVLIAAMAALALSLCACGTKEKKKIGKKDAGKTEAEQKEQRRREFFKRNMDGVLTEKCIYEETEEGEILQKDLQGKELDRHKVPWEEVDWTLEAGSDKRLLYSSDEGRDDGKTVLYHCPIKQTESGEAVLWEQEKKLALVEWGNDGTVLWLEEPYLIYHDGKTLVRLDLETEEKRTLDFHENIISSENTLSYSGEKGVVFFHADGLEDDYGEEEDRDEGDHDSLYRIDIGKWEAEKILSNQNGRYDIVLDKVSKETLLLEYWMEEKYFESVAQFDMVQKKVLGEIPKKRIEKFLDQKKIYGLKDNRDLWVFQAYEYGGRIYLVCSLQYDTVKSSDSAVPYDLREVLLSCPKEDLSALSYEKDISEWWYENTEKEEAEDEYYDAFIHHLGGFVAIFENELYVSYRDPEDHGEHLMMYDLDTKKMQEVGEKELAYQALRSSMNTEYWGKQEASEDE